MYRISIKQILACLFIFFFILLSFSCSIFRTANCYVYADSNNSSMTDADMVDAFKAYCASRDLTIEGSIADAVTTFTSETYNDIVNRLGINPTQLQSQISKLYDNQGAFSRFTFTVLGINGFNRIFAQFLQDNDLSVGDQEVDKIAYSGEYFRDNEGHKCFVWILDSTNAQDWNANKTVILKKGTYLKYSNAYLFNEMRNVSPASSMPLVFYISDLTINTTAYIVSSGSNNQYWYNNNFLLGVNGNGIDYCFQTYDQGSDGRLVNGNISVYKLSNGRYYLGSVGIRSDTAGWYYANKVTYRYANGTYFTKNSVHPINVDDIDIYITSPEIKPELPEDEPLEILPDGTIVEPSPDNPDNPDEPDDPTPRPNPWPNWHPQTPVTPDPDNPDGFNIDWDFDLPDLNINWSLDGLTNKFPFCIPFDMVALYRVLDVEPEAPHFEGQVPIGQLMTWDIDIDLSDYDNHASVIRNVEFVGFIIVLILITIKLVRG